MGTIRSRLASLSLSTSLLVVVGVLGGCGDNAPKSGTGGSGGGGLAGMGGHGVGGTAGGALGGEGGVGGTNVGGAGGLGGGAGVAGAGGAAGTGGAGGAPAACYTTTFTTPAANNATLTVNEDTDHTCADGFQYTVEISSGAPDGTEVSLYAGTTLLKTTNVTGGAASFAVQLGTSNTAQSLSVQYPSTTPCNVTRTVTVSCSNNAPTCAISQPVIGTTHPALNGVPVSSGGDRASSTGSNYQATFKVLTNVEDGQPVSLAVDNQLSAAAITTLNATATGGVATFTATLASDGNWEAVANCTNKNGISSLSTKATFPVDTMPPNLTVNSPNSGQFIVGATVPVCGQTTSTDAAASTSSLGANPANFCVTVGSAATPSCIAMAAVNAATCLNIPCPGAAASNLTVTLRDWAGNPTSQTITGITCVSTLPSVQIIAPASDAPTFNDQTKHILAANAPVGIKDLDANTAGAQVNVVACTDAVGTAVLKVGQQGGALAQLGGSVPTAAAVAGDNCPAGLPNVVKFSGVTLPESTENADGSLAAATALTVTVTSNANANAVGISLPDDVWVDTTPPAVSQVGTVCGQFMQSSSTVHEDLSFNADDKIVVLDVTNGSVTTTYDTPAYMSGVATFPGVALTQGLNAITVTASDPAGNATLMSPNPCTVTIGMAPVVTFTTPTAGAILCPTGATSAACVADNDAGTAGWQGSLAVNVTTGGAPVVTGDSVTFTIGGTTLGSANLDAAGHAQLNGVTIPEGVQTIVATTATIAGAGVGTGSVTVTVDTTPPAAPTGLNVTVLDRRKTSMQLTWTAPADGGGGNVAGYQIRYAKVPIDATNFDNPAVTTAVPYTGAPANAGQLDGISVSGLYVENGYYFAVKATDVAGTRSAISGTGNGGSCTCGTNCCAAHFLETVINSTSGTNEELGFVLDVSGDFNGDQKSDLIVGTFQGQHAYLYLGAGPTFAPAGPTTTLTGSSPGFGNGVAAIGDIDKDGREDFAVADLDAFSATYTGKVYIYRGRASWPSTLADTDADYVVTPDASYAVSNFGLSMARLGDFDGDGVDDFAIGASAYASRVGRVVIVRGKAGGIGNISLPDATNTITIDGDATMTRPIFGYRVVGLGRFYSSGGTTLIASAPGTTNGTNPNNEGHVYAFHGQSGAGTISINSADSVLTGPGKTARIGVVLTNLGPLTNPLPSVGIGNPADQLTLPGSNGTFFVTSGSDSTGPFATKIVGTDTGTSGVGQVLFGGAVSGGNATYSLIGSSTADIGMLSQSGNAVAILDGATLPSAVSIDMATAAQVIVPLPGNWGNAAEAGGGLIPDVNGDGYPDFAVSNAFGAVPGSVVVCY